MDMIHNYKKTFLKFRFKRCYYCEKINFLKPMLSCADCSAMCHRKCRKKYLKTVEFQRSQEVVLKESNQITDSQTVAYTCILNTNEAIEQTISISQPSEEISAELGANMLKTDEGVSMKSAIIVVQNVASPELGRKTMEPKFAIQDIVVNHLNVSEIEKGGDTVQCIPSPDESANKLSPVEIVVAQNDLELERSGKTSEPHPTFNEPVATPPKSTLSSIREKKIYEPRMPERYPFQILQKKRNALYAKLALDTLRQNQAAMEQTMSTSQPSEEMSGLRANISEADKIVTMPSEIIATQNVTSPEMDKETLEPNLGMQNMIVIDPDVLKLEKREYAIESNDGVSFRKESMKEPCTDAVLLEQIDSEPEQSKETMKQDSGRQNVPDVDLKATDID